jgi:Na+/proline symporter
MSVVLMTQKTMSNNRMGVREAGMLWMKALFVVLFVVVILTINFK